MMFLRHLDPNAELRRLEGTFNRMWPGFGGFLDGDVSESWSLPIDVLQEGDSILVSASIPGVDPKNINVAIEAGVLTIKAETEKETEVRKETYLLRERRYGSFYRSVRLPEEVDAEKAETEYKHGVLTINIPKLESKKARVLEVKVRE